MSDAANELIQAFDALSADDRRQVFLLISQRFKEEMPADISDESLHLAAEESFLTLDAAEAQDGNA